MKTEPIYLKDAYRKSCDAKIVKVTVNGKNAKIILNKTIFYAEGGGQPSDQGLIQADNSSFKVEQVRIVDGEIVHSGVLSQGSLKPGDSVTCVLDWNRRYKFMQIHTAGHLLHEAVRTLFPKLVPLEGKHGSKAYIKYASNLKSDKANEILELSNELRDKDLQIHTQFVSLEELKKRSSHLPAKLPSNKPLRIVWFDGFEPIPDGGTQLKSTSELPEFEKITLENQAENVYVHYILSQSRVTNIENQPKQTNTKNKTTSVSSDMVMNIKNQALFQIMDAGTPEELEELRVQYLGRQGQVSLLIRELKNIKPEDRKAFGSLVNEVKNTLSSEITERKNGLTENVRVWFDPTYPAEMPQVGHLHPTSIVIKEMFEIFKHLGFSAMEGPEIESDTYNFEKLNLPKDHPARSLQDVLYIKEPEVLLRSHTSSVETRALQDLKPPFRIVVAGKCYRFENVNASNNVMFYQFQGVALQEGLSMSDLKGTLYRFVKEMFGSRKIRFRTKYYPEVEPGVGLDLDCPFCAGVGCTVCKYRGWIEMLGAGMIHPNILKNFGHDPNKIAGFAFGMGLDRIVMDRFKIKDIRSLYNGDIKY